MIDKQQWITVPQAANLLDLRKRTVKRWVRTGRLQSWRDENGNLGVSFQDVQNLRQELYADLSESAAESPPDEQHDPLFEVHWNFGDTTAEPSSEVGQFISEESAEEDVAVDETVVESTQENASVPEPAAPQTSPRDPLSALEHQAERSIQVAGAAFHEAKELAVAYREELKSVRKEHREELQRVRRIGHVAWMLVAASVLVILGGSWFIGKQYGDQKLYETRVSNLTDRLGETSSTNNELKSRIETLKTESTGVAEQLRTARLGQADAVGQLAAYRAHAGQLTHRVNVLETQIRQERATHKVELAKTQQQAVLLERKRIALIRQQRADEAERERQRLTAQARARQAAAERRQQQASQRQVQTERSTSRSRATLARMDERTRVYRQRNTKANLTLTELEEAMTPKR